MSDDSFERKLGETDGDFRKRIRAEFIERIGSYRQPSLDSWPHFLEVAGEAICGIEVEGRVMEITIYGASKEAQERLERCRMLGQKITYRPVSEAEWLGLKPGEAKLLRDD